MESNVLLGSSGRSYQDGYHIDLLTAIDISDSMRRTAVKITLVKMKGGIMILITTFTHF